MSKGAKSDVSTGRDLGFRCSILVPALLQLIEFHGVVSFSQEQHRSPIVEGWRMSRLRSRKFHRTPKRAAAKATRGSPTDILITQQCSCELLHGTIHLRAFLKQKVH